MTMRALTLIGGTLLAAVVGALLAAVVLIAVALEDQTARTNALRERLITDEVAICAVMYGSPDSEQSRQIAELARTMREHQIAGAADRSAGINRIPSRCLR